MIFEIALIAVILFAHGTISFLIGCAIDAYFNEKEKRDQED